MSSVSDLSLAADGGLLVAGTLETPGGSRFATVKLTADGLWDFSFGLNGRSVTAFSEDAQVGSIAVQDDGKFLLWGNAGNALAIARYHVDGTIDTGFGNHGMYVTAGIDGTIGHAGPDIEILPDGSVLATGYATRDDGRNDVILIKFQNDNPVVTPTVVGVTPDSGRHQDDELTRHGNLVFHGTSVPQTEVSVSINGTVTGTTVTNSTGKWLFNYQ
jgi:uncharacterized delta-60 repeat protein